MDAAALQQIGALPPGALVLLDRTDVAGWNWLGWRGFECDRYSFGSQPHVMRRALVQPQPSPEPAPPKFAVTILA